MGKKLDKGLAKKIVEAATEQYQIEGEVEIDSGLPEEILSTAETQEELIENGGAYVKAWVWVDLSSLDEATKKKYSIE